MNMTIEVQCIADWVFKELDSITSDPNKRKILLCGTWQDISCCLDYMTAARGAENVLPHLIVATNELDPFILKYFEEDSNLHIVDWNETAYEEILIERVKPQTASYKISMVIDFEPTGRRLARIRNFLEMDGTLIIPYEKPAWRDRFAAVMSSFAENNGQFIKLAEIIPAVNDARRMSEWLERSSLPYYTTRWEDQIAETSYRDR
ncbi:unnamed protein product [Calicophoron daubneyi]|uniref:Uncharacterized protein n=1 Tax=Calicophoron daubneyi TaxID=300641 RepID=A0AAV2TJG7_CALDB